MPVHVLEIDNDWLSLLNLDETSEKHDKKGTLTDYETK